MRVLRGDGEWLMVGGRRVQGVGAARALVQARSHRSQCTRSSRTRASERSEVMKSESELGLNTTRLYSIDYNRVCIHFEVTCTLRLHLFMLTALARTMAKGKQPAAATTYTHWLVKARLCSHRSLSFSRSCRPHIGHLSGALDGIAERWRACNRPGRRFWRACDAADLGAMQTDPFTSPSRSSRLPSTPLYIARHDCRPNPSRASRRVWTSSFRLMTSSASRCRAGKAFGSSPFSSSLRPFALEPGQMLTMLTTQQSPSQLLPPRPNEEGPPLPVLRLELQGARGDGHRKGRQRGVSRSQCVGSEASVSCDQGGGESVLIEAGLAQVLRPEERSRQAALVHG